MNSLIVKMAGIAALALAAPLQAQDAPAAGAAAPAALDPEALATAEQVVEVIWPEGAYAEMMRQMMGDGMDQMMGGMFGMSIPSDEEGGEDTTLAEAMEAEDPHYAERMRISNRVMGEFMGEVLGELEPGIRAALARAFARRHSAEHLGAFLAFLNTEAGQAIGPDFLTVYQDPEIMTAMVGDMMPAMFARMDELDERMEEAMAHLPPPPEPDFDDGEDEGEGEY